MDPFSHWVTMCKGLVGWGRGNHLGEGGGRDEGPFPPGGLQLAKALLEGVGGIIWWRERGRRGTKGFFHWRATVNKGPVGGGRGNHLGMVEGRDEGPFPHGGLQ